MQYKAVTLLTLAIGCSAITMREVQQQSPEEVALGMEFRAEDSFGNNELTPPCANIKCGEYSCPAPLELKLDATCCGYCWAEDHVIAVDRHQVTEYNATGHAIEMCESAPSTCKAPGPEVRCFKPQCRAGDAPSCAPGSCCPMCTGR